MQFSLADRTVTLGVGEFAGFSLGPQEGSGGPAGLWRAQLGQHWHNELRQRTLAEAAHATFEVVIAGQLIHRGWTFSLSGRIDQQVGDLLREIKTVMHPLPTEEAALRADYPAYFLQIATYVVLRRTAGARDVRAELTFVEAGSGLSQTIALTPFDEALVFHQLDAIVEFLNLQHRAAEHRRALQFHSPFSALRPGQETIQKDLLSALSSQPSALLFEAPTGYGKTGCVLEFALGQLKAGRFARIVWLTGKSTGQFQVMATLRAMTGMPAASPTPSSPIDYLSPLPAWQVRNKREHCVNHTFHCIRDGCEYLRDAAQRWPASGLSRFYIDDRHPRDLDTLRAAGRAALICPYEITRAALAFNDIWVGDYNYVFAPANRGLFDNQAGFDAAQTLLVVDEAHNLPARVADAYSHLLRAADLQAAFESLRSQRSFASLLLAWEHWTLIVARLHASEALEPSDEADVRDALAHLAPLVANTALDYVALGPEASAMLWQVPALAEWLEDPNLGRLLWSPRAGELAFTCFDAAPAIGSTLRTFGGVVLMSATIGPPEHLTSACGLDDLPPEPPATAALPSDDRLGTLNKRTTRRLYRQLTSAAELLRVEESRTAAKPVLLRATAPWREGAYDIAVDLRVDTSFRQRSGHYATTAATIATLHESSVSHRATPTPPRGATGAIAVFFPSYAYAEIIAKTLADYGSTLRVALQPKGVDLAAQGAWVEESLALDDALFLVLGGSFAEGIDLLGGRVNHAMVVGPALPEVNSVQKARTAALAHLGRDAAFRRVYQVPGLQKVNQALGRLVRAPGQRAKVLLHCRRFADPTYASLLAADYQFYREVCSDDDLATWLLPRPS
jgi:DNA excision repair protein ERCC-2